MRLEGLDIDQQRDSIMPRWDDLKNGDAEEQKELKDFAMAHDYNQLSRRLQRALDLMRKEKYLDMSEYARLMKDTQDKIKDPLLRLHTGFAVGADLIDGFPASDVIRTRVGAMNEITSCVIGNAAVESLFYSAESEEIKRLQQEHPDRARFETKWEELSGCSGLNMFNSYMYDSERDMFILPVWHGKAAQERELLDACRDSAPCFRSCGFDICRECTSKLGSQNSDRQGLQTILKDAVSICRGCCGQIRWCQGCRTMIDTDGDCRLWTKHVSKCQPMQRLQAAAEFQRGVEEKVAQLEKRGAAVPAVLCVHQPTLVAPLSFAP